MNASGDDDTENTPARRAGDDNPPSRDAGEDTALDSELRRHFAEMVAKPADPVLDELAASLLKAADAQAVTPAPGEPSNFPGKRRKPPLTKQS